MTVKHLVVAPGAGPDYDWSNDHIEAKTPSDLLGGRMTMVEDVLKPGFHLESHSHNPMSEVFYVLEGEVTFGFADETDEDLMRAVSERSDS